MVDMKNYLERKIRRMKPSEQRFIHAGREDGVYWRGQDIETFKRIYEETMKMRSMGATRYKAQAMGKLRELIGGRS